MKIILVANLGTTSFKFKLYRYGDSERTVLASGEVESVGKENAKYSFEANTGDRAAGTDHIPDHESAFSLCLEWLYRTGVLADLSELDAVGYKAVHGGSISGTKIVTDELLKEMERVIPLAPAHNPVYVGLMRRIRERYPDLVQVARFETAFHSGIPDFRTTYGVPYAWRGEPGIRKYGFHGSSHEYIAGRVKELMHGAKRVISCHLGGSSSVCAIMDGKSIAVTMGATPQSGLFQNNRVGDFDVFCLPMLMESLDMSLDEVLRELSTRSGFLGLSGVSNDLREVIAVMGENPRARLAVETFVDNMVGFIGMYTAYLGGLDALVFTGGIGTNSGIIRSMVCEKLKYLGISLDEEKNRASGDARVSREDSKVAVWRLKTDEEIVVAGHVYRFLKENHM